MPPTVGRPVGEFRSDFVTEIGVVVRDMAPLTIRHWSDITDAQKAPMIDRLRVIFTILFLFIIIVFLHSLIFLF